ncbi:MAG: hypothetical protein KDD37_02315 [Bdellovibrionales bacterium]|nr:hypothetical protein [Bdellovibrionales bacterium]
MILFLLLSNLYAQIISPQAVEVNFKLESEFVTESDEDPEYLADTQLQHLFGMLHSPEFVESFGLSFEKVEGAGGLQIPAKIKVLTYAEDEKDYIIRYRASGVFLLQKDIAKKLLKAGGLTLPMPYLLDQFYQKKCTDSYYSSFGDFWYFYDPFRKGCEKFGQEPLARDVFITITERTNKKYELKPDLKTIRGDNGNGNKLVISMLNGYADTSRTPDDEGRVTFDEINQYLIESGFKQKRLRRLETSPMYLYEKDIETADGVIKVQIERLLVDTDITAGSKVFAKYFKSAMENSDVIIYSGHSGLGANLDIPSIEAKAGVIHFNQKKKQIAYFDSCSSYSYYLSTFRDIKRRSKIDIITNGLNSYFGSASDVHLALLNHILDVDSSPTWLKILTDMEAPLDGATYLLNVGGI